jgi:fatty-acyl-CoA synthase
VYPREIEEFLFTHPDVLDVQVIGVPDDRYGEEILAYFKPRAGASVGEEELRSYCQGRIAHYKVPRYVRPIDDFPMTVTGKVQKYALRERAIEELGLAVGAPTA